MLRMMVRPRWVLALLLALGIAAAFALLGQWQLERAVEDGQVVERPTEEVQPLTAVAEPGGPTQQSATGQRVEVDGTWHPLDSVLVEGRLNHGEQGWWVVAHLAVTDAGGAGIPVALGWAADEVQARSALEAFAAEPGTGRLVGRFLPSEAPMLPDESADPQTMQTVAVAQLINVWEGLGDRPAYFGYVIASEPPAGLERIDAPAPELEVQWNWLNIFYAVEWIVFGGFAIFLWYRLVRDAYERERDEAAEGGTAGP